MGRRAAGEARAEQAGSVAAPGRCPVPSGRGGAGASAPGQPRGPAGGRVVRVGAEAGRGREALGTCSGPARAPKGPTLLGPGERALLAGLRVALGQLPRDPQPPPGRLGIPCFRAPRPRGRSPFVRGGRMVKSPGEPGRAAGSALLVAATELLPHATAFLR